MNPLRTLASSFPACPSFSPRPAPSYTPPRPPSLPSAVVFTNPTGSDVTLDFSGSGIPAAPRTEFLLTPDAPSYEAFAARVAARASAGQAELGGPSGFVDPPDSLHSDAVFLNGAPLTVDPATALLETYPIQGKPVADPSSPIVVPAYGYGFVVLSGGAAASAAACM